MYDPIIIQHFCEYLGKHSLVLRLVYKGIWLLDKVSHMRYITDVRQVDEANVKDLLLAANILDINNVVIMLLVANWPGHATLEQLGNMHKYYGIKFKEELLPQLLEFDELYKIDQNKWMEKMIMANMYYYVDRLSVNNMTEAITEENIQLLIDQAYIINIIVLSSELTCINEQALKNMKLVIEEIDNVFGKDNLYLITESDYRDCQPLDQMCFINYYTRFVDYSITLMEHNDSPMCIFNSCSMSLYVHKEFAPEMNGKKARRYAVRLLLLGESFAKEEVITMLPTKILPKKLLKRMKPLEYQSMYIDDRMWYSHVCDKCIARDDYLGFFKGYLDMLRTGMMTIPGRYLHEYCPTFAARTFNVDNLRQ